MLHKTVLILRRYKISGQYVYMCQLIIVLNITFVLYTFTLYASTQV